MQDWQARTYHYDGSQPHAVTSLTSGQSSVGSYQYDQNGNMTCRVENGVTWKQDYNTENRISAIHKMNGDCTTGTILESWLFGYDGDGVRVSTARFTGGTADSLSLYFFGGSYEVTDGAVRKYYSFAGQTIAVSDGTTLSYLLSDHLGSIVAVTDSSGTLTSQQRYLPFGQVREDVGAIAQTDFGYTGQRDYPTIGLMDYRARFYDPYLNRFIQPDSLIPNPSSPQAFNRYSYVLNSPVQYTDPSGHYCLDAAEARGKPYVACEDDSGNGFNPPLPYQHQQSLLHQRLQLGPVVVQFLRFPVVFPLLPRQLFPLQEHQRQIRSFLQIMNRNIFGGQLQLFNNFHILCVRRRHRDRNVEKLHWGYILPIHIILA